MTIDQDEWGEAANLLFELKARSAAMIAEHEKLDDGFRTRNADRWRVGFDLLKMFLVISHEYAAELTRRVRPDAVESCDYVFEATINLHARALRVSEEVFALLKEGFPDGALSRWRTVHELAVTATFISKHGQQVAERFIAYRDIASFKALSEYEAHHVRARLMPLEVGQIERAKSRCDQLLKHFGSEMRKPLGWAWTAIEKKKITLSDLERDVGLDHWRPRYAWACDDIHGGFRPPTVGLAVSETTEPVLLVGRSNSGFTDPAHMMAISLNLANHALPIHRRVPDDETLLRCLRLLSDEIGGAFFAVQKAPKAV